ncbi:MAG TPA: hypothetical protein VLC53_07640, partial [Myxococcota bacterium]|nr:hypothetical protein [Myxococcota bacterium]
MPIQDPRYAGWLVGSIRSGLVAIDERGALSALNDAAHRLLGCPGANAGAAIGRDCREALAGEAWLEDAPGNLVWGAGRPIALLG